MTLGYNLDMPIFEYRCAECDTRFEDLVLNGKAAPVACKQCGGSSVERVFSTFSAQASSSNGSSMADMSDPMCGRCGGPGPCAMN